MDRIQQSYAILDSLRLDHGLYLASPSEDYSYVWLRDSCYEVMPYLNKSCNRYEVTYHRLLDMFKEYSWKLEIHQTKKPTEQWEFIHARYDAHTVREIDTPWGHNQFDSLGLFLFGVGEGIKAGKNIIRDEQDHGIIQKLVGYLQCCEYWKTPDNSIWEEYQEVHSNSVGACIAGLQSVRDVVFVDRNLILKGYETLSKMFPIESNDRHVDLAQLSLIFPYKVIFGEDAKVIVDRVEKNLLRTRGVVRYQTDSYYSTLEAEHGRNKHPEFYIGSEAEWTFGIPWLALAHMELGNINKAKEYISWTEDLMLEDGSLPELYFANSNKYNGNTPLGWANAMYILAKERLDQLTK